MEMLHSVAAPMQYIKRTTVEGFVERSNCSIKTEQKRNRIALYCHILYIRTYIHTYVRTYIHTVCGTKKLLFMGINTDTGTDTGVIDNTFGC